MRLSVACNFDEELLEKLDGYPVYELYGKVSKDYAGGGRPSFYLPNVDRPMVERFVRETHRRGIEFNYLLNASCMGNTEYTREGQREIRRTLDWVSEIGCDSVTVGNILLLQIIKRCYPSLKVRISAHRFTDSPRKARFWEDHGADCIVLNETAFAREFGALKAIRAAVSCDLSLIVNNSCRQDCAIAGTHASSMGHGSQYQRGRKRALPLDYHMLFCLDYRFREPVNFVRANWIRPEDLHHYEALGFDNFKIVERNTPTAELIKRVDAYANRRFDGNLLELVLPFNYPQSAYDTKAAQDAFSVRRAAEYFFKPDQVNVTKVPMLAKLGKRLGLLYPRQGPSQLHLDNRKLDSFIDRFLTTSCIDVDCDQCRYCHEFADEALTIDPEFKEDVLAQYRELFESMHQGSFWEMRPGDLIDAARLVTGKARNAAAQLIARK
jgi:collagenase-like PrtC family protease